METNNQNSDFIRDFILYQTGFCLIDTKREIPRSELYQFIIDKFAKYLQVSNIENTLIKDFVEGNLDVIKYSMRQMDIMRQKDSTNTHNIPIFKNREEFALSCIEVFKDFTTQMENKSAKHAWSSGSKKY